MMKEKVIGRTIIANCECGYHFETVLSCPKCSEEINLLLIKPSSVQEQKIKVQCGSCNKIYKVTEAEFYAIKCPVCGSTAYEARVPA